jgi:hypothetical protein
MGHALGESYLSLEVFLTKEEASLCLWGECRTCLIVEFKEVLPKLIRKRKKK